MTWSEYVSRVCGDDQGREFESKTGIDGSTLSRWKKGESGGLRADKVAAFARGYHQNVLEAFVEAGFISPEEAGAAPAGRPDLASISNDELVELVRQRLAESGEGNDRDAASVTTVPGRGTIFHTMGSGKSANLILMQHREEIADAVEVELQQQLGRDVPEKLVRVAVRTALDAERHPELYEDVAARDTTE